MYCLYGILLIILNCVQGDRECGLDYVHCEYRDFTYRSIDGVCNNLDHPNWGTQYSVYDRLIPARYGNNNSIAHCGNGDPLPNARCVSTVIFSDETYPDPELTAYAAQYGQIVAHDMGQNFLTGDPLSCCNTWLGHWDEPPDDCISITIPDDDYHYSDLNASCMSVLRTVTNRQLGCSMYLSDTAQLSGVTAYLDLSLIYGNTEDICMKLRTLEGGLLRLETRNQREWFPESTERDMFCPLLNENELCYHTGDPRVDQNPPLCITHLLWAREHNRVARRLSHLNPHWSDEEIFRIARTIVIAEYQHIAYYELLPYYMGEYNLLESGILYYTDDFINDYNASMRPHVFNEHSQAAFRHFHSLVPGLLSLVDASGCPYRSIVMRDHINRPGVLEKGDYLDSIIRGMVTQPALSPDAYCDPEMTNYFFPMYLKPGLDVRAVDIQRSREHGLGSYNDMRVYCGLGRIHNFYDLLDIMEIEDVEKLISLYDHPDDIDLIVGGSLERTVPGTLAGPTFLCIMFEQFYRTRVADRFFFENYYTGFSRAQLREIRKSSIARLICDNANHIIEIQRHAFVQVSHSNPRIACNKIPGIDLTLWEERHINHH
ncbi:peroxidase-like [Diabrotica undecimpunctata]|uniref:peroxidase-like n=1 Tax=Diabrotica undecimpunctata TaxID=50387 RepID=UPI003B63A372